MSTDRTTIQDWDRQYLWHPFTQHSVWNACEPLVIVGGEGEFLVDADGNRYIDGISSMWCNVLGHRHPAVDAAIKDQVDRISHTTLLGLTHPLAVGLARRLVETAPSGDREADPETRRHGDKEQRQERVQGSGFGVQGTTGATAAAPNVGWAPPTSSYPTHAHAAPDPGTPAVHRSHTSHMSHGTGDSTPANTAGVAPGGAQAGSDRARLAKVFYSDDGSTAVEVAIKMAYAYWHHRGQPQRRKFLALRHAYHGDTIGAVSVGAIETFHGVYRPLLFETLVAPSPYCYRCEVGCAPGPCDMACATVLEQMLERHAGELAAVIVEPLMQCAGGMIAAPAGYLRRVRDACNRHGLPLIADEVATGFGRTGRMFACEHEGVAPDLLCIGKGLTNGYLPLAATLATQEIYDAFLGAPAELKTFFHGHTFTGNPLGCAAALATLDAFERQQVLASLPARVQLLKDRLARLAGNRWVGDTRQCGLLAGIELVADKASRREFPYVLQVGARVCMAMRNHGAILRPLGNTLVIFPPLCISMENLSRLMDIVETCVDEVVPKIVASDERPVANAES